MDPKIFLKAPWAPTYTNFEGERLPKKKEIFNLKRFLACFFFKILPVAQKFGPKQGLFSALGELGKPIWSTLQKKVDKTSKVF